jgi:hypothetical protein
MRDRVQRVRFTDVKVRDALPQPAHALTWIDGTLVTIGPKAGTQVPGKLAP